MKNFLLRFLTGILCLCCSQFLFAQTNAQSGSNSQITDETNDAALDSSFGFYIKYADKKEPQKPVNNNGNEESSLIVSSAQTHAAVSKNLKEERIHVQPNPAKDFAYIKIEATREYKFTIEVASVAGKLLQRKTGKANEGMNIINLDLHAYTKGIYIITVIDDKGTRKTMKVVKE